MLFSKILAQISIISIIALMRQSWKICNVPLIVILIPALHGRRDDIYYWIDARTMHLHNDALLLNWTLDLILHNM